MIDINTYRSRIGLFSPKLSDTKFLLREEFYKKSSWNENKSGELTLSVLCSVFKIVTLLVLCQYSSIQYYSEDCWNVISQPSISQSVSLASINAAASTLAGPVVGCSVLSAWWGAGTGYRGARGENITIESEIIDQNFEARYKHGNIKKKAY